mmetsp:Transcript_20890/g.21674  ORF Transcript_20890/g.21674 Transcript_20890/m.21674 type:complete len:95 (+) Transcript_20890:3-287(+)
MNSAKPAFKHLKELRVILCPVSNTSLGLRSWLKTNFVSYSRNKDTQFLIRECADVESVILARYEKGVEKRIIVNDCNEDEIEELVQKLKVGKFI